VLICKSQLWPEGAPAEAGLLGDSVSERGRACGLWTRRVDGADVVARRTLADVDVTGPIELEAPKRP
jgi:pyruvate dehydrogenase E1 component alpha subunit